MRARRLTADHERELLDLAAVGRATRMPLQQLAQALAHRSTTQPGGGIGLLWAHRLARGWTRAEAKRRYEALAAANGLAPALGDDRFRRWELGAETPDWPQLDLLCELYESRPDLLGYGRDHTPAAARPGERPARLDGWHATAAALTLVEADGGSPGVTGDDRASTRGLVELADALERIVWV